MILEMDDGREFKLADDIPDDTARMLKALVQSIEAKAKPRPDDTAALFKQLIGALEERARAAEEMSAALRGEVIALTQQVGRLVEAKAPKVDDGLRKEIAALSANIAKMAAMKHEKGPERDSDDAAVAEIKAGLARLEKIARAPTKWVYDAAGEIVGGKKDV